MTKEEAIQYNKNLKEYMKITDERSEYKFLQENYEALDLAIKALKQEPKTGHWIGHREHCENFGVMPSGLSAYEWCSNCDCGIDVREWYRNNYNYCPNCGAKMVKPQESEDK